ncbi:DNA-binding transcriptional regulator, LysR family [Rhizobium sp. NFR07]|uniref:LysR family transcriptional regulator n=1 Tax=Rhizobium sp. NFR07 TaxID=1566262 RepID=UPI0008E059F6|nr:LysR family transcriptional regulator [Rhizobium sp. NFR07]SFA79711.1 DNA-binding transcriptional regulator, LysR family [Rhizobium sp. NFR07]
MINDAFLRKVDLNLLLSFSVLMQERNVSRAAERLLVGQPGLSAALKRLRETLDDELFVRVGRGLQPTARALAIAPAIEAALESIEQAIRPPAAFDPGDWQGEFRVSMCDNLERAFFGPLAAKLRSLAPHARLASISSDTRSPAQMLDDCAFDFSVSVHAEPASWQVRSPLFEQAMMCIYDPRQVTLKGPMTLDDFVRLPHVAVSAAGTTEREIDGALRQLGRSRSVIATVQRFSGLPAALSAMPCMAIIPESIARLMADLHKLTVVDPPLPLPSDAVSMLYRRVDEADGRSIWFRRLFAQVAEEVLAASGCRCEVARAA